MAIFPTTTAINDGSSGQANNTYDDVLSRILPDCYIYISHLDLPEESKYWQLPGYPDELTDQMGSTFMDTTALGRSAPVYTYSKSGPRSISITLRFHRDMFEEMPSNVTPKDGEDKAESFIHALQAIAVPKYNLSNKAIEPPLVAIRLGQEVFIKGVVNGNISVTYKKPILVNEKYAIIEASFTVNEVDPYDASTIFKNGSFRGMMATLRKGMNF
jgi:hypothetical protein